MSRGPIIYSPPPGTEPQSPGDVVQSAVWNAFVQDVTLTFNTVQPEEFGGTNASTFLQARQNMGLAWEIVPNGAVTSPAGTTTVSWINLSPFRYLQLHWDIVPTGVTQGVYMRVGTDNGGSWKSGATDYRYQGSYVNNGVSGTTPLTDAPSVPLVSAGLLDNISAGYVKVLRFNTSGIGYIVADTELQSLVGARSDHLSTALLNSGTRNAIQFRAANGSFEGRFLLEGAR